MSCPSDPLRRHGSGKTITNATLPNHILGLPVPLVLLIAVLVIATLGYIATRNRALSRAEGDARGLHSLPNYYGLTAAMFAAVPAFGAMVIRLMAQPMLVQNAVLPLIPVTEVDSAGTQSLILSDVTRVANGLDVVVAKGVLDTPSVEALAQDPSGLRETLKSVSVALASDVKP